MSTITEIARKSTHLPHDTLPFNYGQNVIRLYPSSNYKFDIKDAQEEEDPSVPARLARLQEQYDKHGMRRTVEALIMCHDHAHPYVLMLQIANTFYKLPGSYLSVDEEEIEGLKRSLNETVAPPSESEAAKDAVNYEWDIGDCVSQWWRPNFEVFMYPYVPPHITRPKECKKMYLVQLPEKRSLYVPMNMKLVAVPLFELFTNHQKYGNQVSSIPLYLSRYNFEMVNEEGQVIARYPNGLSGQIELSDTKKPEIEEGVENIESIDPIAPEEP
jgi:cleavage and polyadenylation specificity factor subunit 5